MALALWKPQEKTIINWERSIARMYLAISIVKRDYGATGSSPLVERLDNGDEVAPPKTTPAPPFHIPIRGAAPGLRAIPTAVDVLTADGSVESAESLTDLSIGLLVDEVATGGGAHLAFGLFNEQGLGSTHKDGAGLCRDGGDVASNESVVGGGGDDGGHIKKR